MKCPCLWSEVVPLCRADTDALRIPAAAALESLCLVEEHRRCDLYRRHLEALEARPTRWQRGAGTKLANVGHPAGSRETDPQRGREPMKLIKRLLVDDSAQDLAEYGIALAVIAVGVGAIALALSSDINTLWTNAQTAIHNAV